MKKQKGRYTDSKMKAANRNGKYRSRRLFYRKINRNGRIHEGTEET